MILVWCAIDFSQKKFFLWHFTNSKSCFHCMGYMNFLEKIVMLEINVKYINSFRIFVPPIKYHQKEPPEMFCKKGVFKNFVKFTGKHLCQSLFFNEIASLRPATLLKQALAQVFSSEFCEIFKNTVFTEYL